MKLDYSQILINENAYFFKLRRKLTRREIEVVFEESLKDKNGKRAFEPKLRESFVHGSREIAKISFDVFEYKKRPSFLTKDVQNVFELKFGIFLIIESNDLVAVVKKNVSGIKTFYALVDKIDYNVLVRFLLNADTKFEKIVTNSMNAASNSMHKKTNEAEDLQTTLSRFGTSKQIISAIRLANKENKSTVTVNTSRVNSFNVQNEFVPALLWMVKMMDLIRRAASAAPENHFIDSFAVPVNYEDIIDDLEPSYLVVRLDALKDEIDNGQIEKIYNAKTKRKIDLNRDVLGFERLTPLTLDKTGAYIGRGVKVKVRKESIGISIIPFKEIVLDFGNGYTTDLNTYVKIQSYFMIVFDKPQFVYSHGMVFRDSRLLGDKENFMKTFITYAQLGNIDSEKGLNYSSTSTQFKPYSLFRFVDDHFSQRPKYLLCDDLGVEWGDFISVADDEIVFFHLKHNDDGLSAKNLESVFGQAQKNFGFLQLTEEMIEKRRERWRGNYRLNNVPTAIKRMRKNPPGKNSIEDLIKYSNEVTSNPNVRRKIFVVVNFISKSELSKMFDKVKSGNTLANQGVVLQMIWFIHGILALATEQAVEFRILCRP